MSARARSPRGSRICNCHAGGNPIETWQNKEEYDNYLKDLISKFQENFKKFDVSSEIISAGPGFND